jgi:hypothetical protein
VLQLPCISALTCSNVTLTRVTLVAAVFKNNPINRGGYVLPGRRRRLRYNTPPCGGSRLWLPVACSELRQHPCFAGTSGIRSACNSVGKALWSKTTGGSLLDKGASVEYFTSGWYQLPSPAWPLVQEAPRTCQRNNPFRWSYVVWENDTTASAARQPNGVGV